MSSCPCSTKRWAIYKSIKVVWKTFEFPSSEDFTCLFDTRFVLGTVYPILCTNRDDIETPRCIISSEAFSSVVDASSTVAKGSITAACRVDVDWSIQTHHQTVTGRTCRSVKGYISIKPDNTTIHLPMELAKRFQYAT
jgi:hypothetical protein